MEGKSTKERKRNPRENANIFSAVTFTWVWGIFWKGYRRDLELEDLPRPLNEHTSRVVGGKLAAAWDIELQNAAKRKKTDSRSEKGPSLLRAVLRVFGSRICFYGIFISILEIIPLMIRPIALAGLLRCFSSSNVSTSELYFYAGMLIMSIAISVIITHPYIMCLLHLGMKVRVACSSLIYRKALKLSKSALDETTVGQAVNLLSNDVSRFDLAILFLPDLWSSPLKAIIVTGLLYYYMGVASIYGVVSLLMFIPLQAFLGKRISILRFRTAIRSDERIRLTNEIINGIQAIKMYTWEQPFSCLVEKARKREISAIRMSSYIRGITAAFMMFSSRLSLFVTLFAYILAEAEITAEKVFMLTACFDVLREAMSIFFPLSITRVAEACVSIKRIEKYLVHDEVSFNNFEAVTNGTKLPHETMRSDNCRELEDVGLEFKNITNYNNQGLVTLKDITVKWKTTDIDEILTGINLSVKPGQLVAVVGQVGSGKSSLFNVILRELPTSSGVVSIPNRVSYASQEPWLFAASVRQNILFGRPLDQKKYDQVVRVCQLRRDFSLLPFGDRTIVSDRGISLSGGQRARINLARAVYADAPLYLLDDPLSAVDAHVGKHIFEECIEKYLSGRTRILVTHQVQFLKNVEKIIVMRDGEIVAEGTYDELVEKEINFGNLDCDKKNTDSLVVPVPMTNRSRNPSISTSYSSLASHETTHNAQDPEEVEELRTKGKISRRVYLSYFRAGGNLFINFVVLVLFIVAQVVASGSDYFMAYWVDLEESWANSTGNITSNSTKAADDFHSIRMSSAYIFTGLVIGVIAVVFLRNFTFFWMCMRASKTLHDRMFRSITRATMRFFNTNTSGRILNRFSKDMGAVDELLTDSLMDTIEIGLIFLGVLIVVSLTSYWLIVPAIALGILLYFLRIFYIATSRSIKRLDGITRSPVLNHLSMSLRGLTTIRSSNASSMLINEFDEHLDLHSSAWYIYLGTSRAFAVWLDFCCLVYVTSVVICFLILADYDLVAGGTVGLAITQSIGLTGLLQWGIRQSAELENHMTSTERVLEYTNLESEPPLESQGKKKPRDYWPEEGKIEFNSVQLTYAPLEPPVLKNLNFTIEPRERVGIVGRTGAGKSSLIAALFRLADIEGKIEIDGVDTGDIGLHDLRSKISIIPQEPFLFAGSLRKNLDPFEQYTDGVLWAALEDVELKEMGLEMHVSDGGGNLSVGQRQLVCLARAIVRNNRILVLDEATANVDLRTDELIQETIRRKFTNCTVLTIAHRLNTVMDSDRILVMDGGSAVEFDHPHVLLQNREGYLFGLVQETGETTAEALTAIARDNYTI